VASMICWVTMPQSLSFMIASIAYWHYPDKIFLAIHVAIAKRELFVGRLSMGSETFCTSVCKLPVGHPPHAQPTSRQPEIKPTCSACVTLQQH
jgi:hypothetical protein